MFVDLSLGVKVYLKIKIEGLKFLKEFGGISVSIEKFILEGMSIEIVSEIQMEILVFLESF